MATSTQRSRKLRERRKTERMIRRQFELPEEIMNHVDAVRDRVGLSSRSAALVLILESIDLEELEAEFA